MLECSSIWRCRIIETYDPGPHRAEDCNRTFSLILPDLMARTRSRGIDLTPRGIDRETGSASDVSLSEMLDIPRRGAGGRQSMRAGYILAAVVAALLVWAIAIFNRLVRER